MNLSGIIKKLFYAISVRERLLLCIFLWLGVIIWVGSQMRAYREELQDYRMASVELTNQKSWLDNREIIESELTAALKRLDPERSFSSPELVGKVDDISRSVEPSLNFNINSPVTRKGEIITLHSVRLQVRRAGLRELILFDQNLKKESPYLGLEKIQIISNRSNPNDLNVQFEIASFETSKSDT